MNCSPPFVEMHRRIAGTDSVGFRVRSVGGEQHDRDSVQRCLREKLTEMRREEIRRGMVLVGPHRDDLIIELNGKSAQFLLLRDRFDRWYWLLSWQNFAQHKIEVNSLFPFG